MRAFDTAIWSRLLDDTDQRSQISPASPPDPPRLDTGLLPPEVRFDFWRETVAQTFTPMDVRTGRPEGFRGLIEGRDLGGVNVASVSSTECTGVRTAKMVRQGDAELLQLALSMNSRTTVHEDRQEAVIGPSDFALYSTSRPYVIDSKAEQGLVRGIMVLLPQTLLSVPVRKVEKLTPAVLPGRSGIGALLANYLIGLVGDTGQYPPPDAVRLGTVLVDLLAALVANRVDDTRQIPPDSHHRLLLLRIHTFIEEHLDDPQLTPATVAAAHHISLRVLHRLFQDQELGIAAWIRHRRLERCRRELADPGLRDRPIQAIAGRCGFISATHFSRLFRATYGLTPQEYRTWARPSIAAPRPA